MSASDLEMHNLDTTVDEWYSCQSLQTLSPNRTAGAPSVQPFWRQDSYSHNLAALPPPDAGYSCQRLQALSPNRTVDDTSSSCVPPRRRESDSHNLAALPPTDARYSCQSLQTLIPNRTANTPSCLPPRRQELDSHNLAALPLSDARHMCQSVQRLSPNRAADATSFSRLPTRRQESDSHNLPALPDALEEEGHHPLRGAMLVSPEEERGYLREDREGKSLKFAYASLPALPYFIIDRHWHWVRTLDLTGNSIRDVEFLAYFEELETVILDHNLIWSQTVFPVSTKIKSLSINHNSVSRAGLHSFIDNLAGALPFLEVLSMLGNPGVIAGGIFHDNVLYRLFVISRFSRLYHLDDRSADEDEKSRAAQMVRECPTFKVSQKTPRTSPLAAAFKIPTAFELNSSNFRESAEAVCLPRDSSTFCLLQRTKLKFAQLFDLRH